MAGSKRLKDEPNVGERSTKPMVVVRSLNKRPETYPDRIPSRFTTGEPVEVL